MDLNHLNLRVADAASCRDFYERRCRDPDGTEIEVLWESP